MENETKKTQPSKIEIDTALMKLLLLPENEAEFTKDDWQFLASDLVGKILKHWPMTGISLTKLKKEARLHFQ